MKNSLFQKEHSDEDNSQQISHSQLGQPYRKTLEQSRLDEILQMNLSSHQWSTLIDTLMFQDSKNFIELFHTNQNQSSSAQNINVEGEVQQNMQRRNQSDEKKQTNSYKNSHKVYHNFLKNYMEIYMKKLRNSPSFSGRQKVIKKLYQDYYNCRVYFVLMLWQIVKITDGKDFLNYYRKEAENKIQKEQIKISKSQPNSRKAVHLSKVIDEIDYSIKACEEFVKGDIYAALKIVYQRHQEKINNKHKFNEAVKIVNHHTGLNLSLLSAKSN